MLQVRRFASTMVGALAIMGCAGDNIVAPTTAHLTEQTVTPRLVTEATAATSVVSVDGPATRDSIATTLSVFGSTKRGSALELGYSHEQSLGFKLDTPTSQCMGEGESTGAWELRYSGFGCVELTAGATGTTLSMAPATADGATETHAPLMLGPQFGDRMTMTARVETVQQLRRNAEPNAWEVAWIVWQYTDDEHFYYFIPKPDGWELGKRDPSYNGGQRFLATSNVLKFPVGKAYNVQITHRGNLFSVVVDGVAIVSFTDTERPYLSGRIALYAEDAAIRVHQVSVRTGDL